MASYGLADSLRVGKYTLVVSVAREGLIAQRALGDLTGKTPRQLIADRVGKVSEIYPWKKFQILDFRYAPIMKDGKTTGAERWEIDFEQMENPVPIMAIVAGVGVLAGLSLIYLTFDSLNDLADKAPEFVGGLGILLVVFVGVWLWRKFGPSS